MDGLSQSQRRMSLRASKGKPRCYKRFCCSLVDFFRLWQLEIAGACYLRVNELRKIKLRIKKYLIVNTYVNSPRHVIVSDPEFNRATHLEIWSSERVVKGAWNRITLYHYAKGSLPASLERMT